MANITLISLATDNVDVSSRLARALAKNGANLDVVNVPFTLNYGTGLVRKLNALIRDRSRAGHFVIFFSNTTELYLRSANLMILFSGYRRWFDPAKMHVIPHLWTPIQAPQTFAHLEWKQKPPLRIGFMGTTRTDSRIAKWAGRCPEWFKDWLLAGYYLKRPFLKAALTDVGIPLQNLCAFSRTESLVALRDTCPKDTLDIVERARFSGHRDEKEQYVAQLQSSTYIPCPRGTENYSYRVYEALSFGRVPVIVDTDMVVPNEIIEQDLAVIVPYKRRAEIYQIIKEDYETRTETDFLSRQTRAIEFMHRIRGAEWLDGITARIFKMIERSTPGLRHYPD